MPVVMDITKHERTYIGFNGEILDGINGKPIGQINQDDVKIPNQTTNPTENKPEGEVGAVKTEEGKG